MLRKGNDGKPPTASSRRFPNERPRAPPRLKRPPPRPLLPPPDRDTPERRQARPRGGAAPGAGSSASACSVLFGGARARRLAALPAASSSRRIRRAAGRLCPGVRVEEVTQRLGTSERDVAGHHARPSRQQISMPAPAAMCRSAMSISAITSRPGSSSRRLPHPNSSTRSRNIRIACSRPTRRGTRTRRNSRWPRSPGGATRCSSSKAG